MLRHPNDILPWNPEVPRNIQPHDEEAPEVEKKTILVLVAFTVLKQFVHLVVL